MNGTYNAHVNSRMKWPWLGLLIFVCASAFAQDVQKPLRRKSIDATMSQKSAREALKGYYAAIFKGEFDRAAGFMHPDAMRPVRQGFAKQLDQATPAQQAKTLQELQLASRAEFDALSDADFYLRFVRSSYGIRLRALADPKLGARMEIKKVVCAKEEYRCVVDFDMLLKNGTKADRFPNSVWIKKEGGFWLLGGKPNAPQ